MKSKYIENMITAVWLFIAMYFLGSFGNATFDINAWDVGSRWFLLTLYVISVILALGLFGADD